MPKPTRLVTEFTDAKSTAKLLEGALHHGIETADDAYLPVGRLTIREVASVTAMVLFALGEVYERQFFPSDREQCQEVAGEILSLAGIRPPEAVLTPEGR